MTFTLALGALLVMSAMFALASFGYVAGSFLMMRAHTAPRPPGKLAREALGELFWTLVTQPLLPLFYLFGRRLGGASSGTPVIFVHGYGQNRVGFLRLARALRAAGRGPLYGFNYPWFLSMAQNAARLGGFVDEARRATGEARVDLVCHSMGGLVALEYLRRAGPGAPVRRCVTIATPHAGVLWRGPIPGLSGPELRSQGAYLKELAREGVGVEVLSIFSTHDNVVYPPESSMLAARGGRDVSLPGGGHISLLFSPRVAELTVSFLSAAERPPPAAAPRPHVETARV